MKRVNFKYLFSFGLGAIIFSSITAYAVSLASNSISFTTSKNPNVHTVEDALIDLYSKSGTSAIRCVDPVTNDKISCPSTIGVGTKIAIGDGNTQRFWVISNHDGVVRALAEYNINVGGSKASFVQEGLQFEGVGYSNAKGSKSSIGYGTMYYSASDYSYDTSNLKPFCDSYLTTINGSNYANNKVINADLIGMAELEELGCTSNSSCVDTGYTWLYSTTYSYFTREAGLGNVGYVLVVSSDGSISGSQISWHYYYGIRPVITLNASDIG